PLPAISAVKCCCGASSLKSDATFYLIIKLSARRCATTQGPPMRDWLFLLAPPALIFYFIAYPDKFYEFVFLAKRLIGGKASWLIAEPSAHSNDTPTLLPSVQTTRQCLEPTSPSIV